MTFACPNCAEENPTLIRGREMAIENIEVPD
jgi:Zn finger protein HypA/HybF involved in hydrogenase expression